MSTTTFQNKTFQAATAPSVGFALGQLMNAVMAKLSNAPKSAPVLTAAEEANRVREMAYDYLATDPGYAADLFAAADRHERANA